MLGAVSWQPASDNGVYDTSTYNGPGYSWSHVAFSTVQAALNIARYPGATSTGTTSSSGTQTVTGSSSGFVSAIYNLETGTVPFTPNLHSSGAGAPTYWIAAVTFSGPSLPDGVAIDASGNVWASEAGTPGVYEMSNSGNFTQSIPYTYIYTPDGIAIDTSGYAWTSSAGAASVQRVTPSGSVVINFGFTTNGYTPIAVAVDGSNDGWIASTSGVYELSSAQVPLVDYGYSSSYNPRAIAIDQSGNAWTVSGNGYGSVQRLTPSSVININYGFTSAAFSLGSIAIDAGGNAWIGGIAGGVVEFSPTNGVVLFLDYSVGGCASASGYHCSSIAVDGSGNVWAASGVNYVEEVSGESINLNITGESFYYPSGIAVDGSGNVWVANYSGNDFTELIGAATPVVTPLAAGVANGTLATRP